MQFFSKLSKKLMLLGLLFSNLNCLAQERTVKWVLLTHGNQILGGADRRVVKLCIPDQAGKYYWQLFYLSSGQNSTTANTLYPFYGLEPLLYKKKSDGSWQLIEENEDIKKGDETFLNFHLQKPFEFSDAESNNNISSIKQVYLGNFVNIIPNLYYSGVFDPDGIAALFNFKSALDSWAESQSHKQYLTFESMIDNSDKLSDFIQRLDSLRLLRYSHQFKSGIWSGQAAGQDPMLFSLAQKMRTTSVFVNKIPSFDTYKFNSNPTSTINMMVPNPKLSDYQANSKLEQFPGDDFEHKCNSLGGKFARQSQI
jgi:hypothetical protein